MSDHIPAALAAARAKVTAYRRAFAQHLALALAAGKSIEEATLPPPRCGGRRGVPDGRRAVA